MPRPPPSPRRKERKVENVKPMTSRRLQLLQDIGSWVSEWTRVRVLARGHARGNWRGSDLCLNARAASGCGALQLSNMYRVSLSASTRFAGANVARCVAARENQPCSTRVARCSATRFLTVSVYLRIYLLPRDILEPTRPADYLVPG